MPCSGPALTHLGARLPVKRCRHQRASGCRLLVPQRGTIPLRLVGCSLPQRASCGDRFVGTSPCFKDLREWRLQQHQRRDGDVVGTSRMSGCFAVAGSHKQPPRTSWPHSSVMGGTPLPQQVVHQVEAMRPSPAASNDTQPLLGATTAVSRRVPSAVAASAWPWLRAAAQIRLSHNSKSCSPASMAGNHVMQKAEVQLRWGTDA
jgi:hypothetical protein